MIYNLANMSKIQRPRPEQTIGQLLKSYNLTLSVAESCTGGLLSDKITNVSGSSKYFIMTIVAYSNKSKTDFLGVPPAVIKEYGAVSRETAQLMAENIRKKAETDISLSITGIAGPTAPGTDKPAGLIYIGLSSKKKPTRVEEYHFRGNRIEIKNKAVEAALKLLSDFLRAL
jgi:nicotinamide-nucleotide amidase